MASLNEVDEVFPEDVEDEEESAPLPVVGHMCRYCPAGPFKTTATRRRHETRTHPDEASVATQTRRIEKATGGIPESSLTERAKEFAEAVEAAAPDLKSNSKKQLIQAFENESELLVRNERELEDFLDDYGLTIHQIRQIRRRIIGRKGALDANTGGNQQVMAINPTTGQQVPVIVLGGQGSPSPGQPIIIAQPERPDTPPGLTRADVKEMMEDMVDKITASTQQPPAVSPNIRVYQEPIINQESGKPQLDDKGQIMIRYVQEPIDPMASTMKMMKEMGLFDKETGPVPATIDQIIAGVRETIKDDRPAGPSPEITELTRKFDSFMADSERDAAVSDAVEKTVGRLMNEYRPSLDKLRELETQSGLNDFQAELMNSRETSREMMKGLEGFRDGVRDDLKPLVHQFAAGNLRNMGFSEQATVDILAQSQAGPSTSDTTPADIGRRRRLNTMQNWAREG